MAEDHRWKDIGNAINFINTEGLEFREYQLNIIKSIFEHGNTLVVLPTGLGKTFIAVAAVADALSRGKKALFLAPTKPLSEQHYAVLGRMLKLNEGEMLLLIGSTGKNKRREQEQTAKIIVGTPQTVANDLKGGYLSLDGFGVVAFDECHRAVGKYAYKYIANECNLRDVLIVGLTASPGGNAERINELVESLNIKHIEARTSTDYDVAKYVMPKNVHVVEVERSKRIDEIASLIAPEAESSLASLNKMGLLHFKSFTRIPKGRLIEAGNEISRIQARNYRFGAIFSYVKLLNSVHAYDLLLTEGIYPFQRYLESLYAREKKSRAVENLLKSRNVIEAKRLAEEALKNGEEHPKVFAVLDIIKDYRDKSIIVFAQYRSTIKMLVEFLRNNGFNAKPFVGKKEGITQEIQKKVIEDFRERSFNVLVASSIGEEGLDIPSVDLVLFYEPIPNEIRNIQRKGRTGRFRAGEVYILVAKETKDEIYLYVSRKRERRMLAIIKSINSSLLRRGDEGSEARQKLL